MVQLLKIYNYIVIRNLNESGNPQLYRKYKKAPALNKRYVLCGGDN